jgi:short subunit dehydrogenase-like uncharacterized protein
MAVNMLLYGANGYTGKLIAGLSAEYGLQPILAGRNAPAIQKMSEDLNLPYRVGSLQSETVTDELLKDISLVLHAAGPFSVTAKPMMEGCIRNHVHYLDITGEIPVFEMAKQYHNGARHAGIMLMPGVGFDVVPTDCLALYLKEQLPDATSLEIAFTSSGGGLSHGTATTMALSLGQGGAIRENGKIVPKPLGFKSRKIDFGTGPSFVMSIPWGDVSTAFHTTGIPDIITYTAIKPSIYKLLKLQSLFNWLLRTNWAKEKAISYINRQPAGPSDAQRISSRSLVWAEVTNHIGEKRSARLSGPDGYTLTAHSSLIITKKVMEGNFQKGYQTPAGCYGSSLVLEVPGVTRS